MAYSNYGAFVYRNGHRRRDKEDAPVLGSEDILCVGNGARIYVQLSAQLAGIENKPWEDIAHGVLGDGHIRVSVSRDGVYACSVYVFDDAGNCLEVYKERDIRRMCGVSPESYPAWRDDMDEEEQKAHDSEVEAYYAATKHGYDWSFEVDGCKIGFNWQANSDDPDDDNPCHAWMIEPDGTRWDAWYGSCYGAGWTDTDALCSQIDAYDELGEDGLPVPTRTLHLEDAEFEYDGAIINGIYDGNRKRLVGVNYAYVQDDDTLEPEMRSSFTASYRHAYLDAGALADILNLGIALAHRGYTSVSACGDALVNEKTFISHSYGKAFPDDDLPESWTGELLERVCRHKFELLPPE